MPLALGPAWLVVVFILGQQLIGDGADTVFEIGVVGLRQAQTTNAVLGRVSSIWQVLTWFCTLVGTVAGGAFAVSMGLKETLWMAVLIRMVGLAVSTRLMNKFGNSQQTTSYRR